MSYLIIKSNSLSHLYAAKGANRWAFAPRVNDTALLTFLKHNLQFGSGIIGVYTDSNTPKNPNYGALLYGYLSMGSSEIKLNETTDTYWDGPYNIVLNINWYFIKPNEGLISKQQLKDILGSLNKGGHYPQKILEKEFLQIIRS